MKFSDAGKVEELVWDMRLADLPRGENRTILNRLYNGEPPFNPEQAEENNIQINRSDLEGVNLMSQARRQWLQAFLPSGNFFNVALDSGPQHKRREFSHSITRHANRVLKRSRCFMEQSRATGANVMLHGIGPVMWDSRRSVVPVPLPISSVMIPSETDIDFQNLTHLAVFREWTPARMYEMTHGPKVDPGWNMDLVQSQWKYVREQTQKQPNATAFQYMPERIEELKKEDLGWWGSDAVPTIDAWDFYFREEEDGKGWYRRIILDWGPFDDGAKKGDKVPTQDSNGKFLYTSEHRKFANSLSEILHCQFGDCSAVAPFKYWSVRSLGWMLWGVCDLQNRLHCKFNESVFEQLMWFFRTASNQDMVRLKKANFYHMGVIPPGISFVPANERYKPDTAMLEMAFGRNRQLMQDNAASFTQDFTHGDSGKEMTATETMARVNTTNALVSGMLSLAYAYEEYKDREVMRRLCIKHNPDPLARKFRIGCLQDGVPPELLDVERMDITRERVLGGGNKTLEMAQVQFLQSIRKNLGPDAQRRVDHISIESATDDATMAEDLAPLEGQKLISDSMHDAQLSTERLMRGLPFVSRPDMVSEDYVKVWMTDLAMMVQKAMQSGGMATADQITGFQNMAQHIGQFLKEMESDDELKPRVKQYQDALKNLMNQVKAFAQRLQQQMQKRNGAGGPDPETQTKLQGKLMLDKAKADNMRESHAARTAQKQISFEMQEQQKDRKSKAELRRAAAKDGHELAVNRLRSFQE